MFFNVYQKGQKMFSFVYQSVYNVLFCKFNVPENY